MKTCPNCGNVEGGHSSILQGCVCQYSMQAPPQRTWQGLTDEDIAQGWKESWVTEQAWQSAVWWAEDKLKEKNGYAEENT